jgi:hypothetical protein
VSVPSAELTAPSIGAPSRASAGAVSGRLAGWRLYAALAAGALVISALSLLIPSTPSYDPWAWLVWGREIVHANLQTTGGPSWKPLPMIFTTVFAPFGKAQPDLWLVIARGGAVMTAAMVFKVAWRLTRQLVGEPATARTGAARRLALAAPLLAGLIATGSLINSGGFISDNALGYSEGLATALVLIAIDSYMDGARRQAFVVGFFAALDRPELWFFWGPYGLYLFWRDPGARKLVIGLFALIPVVWFLPELWGSGHLLRGVTRAQHPRSNSAAFAKCPVCTVFKKEAWPAVLNRVKIAGILAMLVAAFGLWRTRRSWWRRGPIPDQIRARAWLVTFGVFGFVWWLGIAFETQAGFSGNNRYLVLGTAPVAIVGGVAWGWFAHAASAIPRRLADLVPGVRRRVTASVALFGGAVIAVVLFLAVPPWIGQNIISTPRTHRALIYQAHLRDDAALAVRELGGPGKVLACGTVMTEGFQVPMLAYDLGVHTLSVQASPIGPPPPAPNVIFQTRAQRNASLLPVVHTWANVPYKLVADVRTFRVFEHCAGKVSG